MKNLSMQTFVLGKCLLKEHFPSFKSNPHSPSFKVLFNSGNKQEVISVFLDIKRKKNYKNNNDYNTKMIVIINKNVEV